MIDRPPYTLTTGVTATREGLRVADWRVRELIDDHRWPEGVVPWLTVAQCLRYREGEPGIQCDPWGNLSLIASSESANLLSERLHRLAAIICDDAEAFRVLHWCVENLAAG
jgi:hypothetical protein